MRYSHVRLAGLGYTLPDEILTSDALEARLEPAYTRLRMPAGRLELMTGIKARRMWPQGTLPSEPSTLSVQRAIAASGLTPGSIGALIHSSVCRDHLEPATACKVHHRTGLPSHCMLYDVSNACLGFLNGMFQAANMIELGQIQSAVVVSSEGSRELVEGTIAQLNTDHTITRETAKLAFASLTIGSASVAAVLTHESLSPNLPRVSGGDYASDTSQVHLCHSGRDEAVAGEMKPLMTTDSEALMHAGVALGASAYRRFLASVGWAPGEVTKSICHQVGLGHRKLMLSALELNPANDFITLDQLGNTGSAACPVTLAKAAEAGFLAAGDKVAMLGIGSGINTVMLGLEWQACPVQGGLFSG